MFSPDIGHVQALAIIKMRIHCPVCVQSVVYSENMNNSLCLTEGLKIGESLETVCRSNTQSSSMHLVLCRNHRRIWVELPSRGMRTKTHNLTQPAKKMLYYFLFCIQKNLLWRNVAQNNLTSLKRTRLETRRHSVWKCLETLSLCVDVKAVMAGFSLQIVSIFSGV